jgi:hypothetical protein
LRKRDEQGHKLALGSFSTRLSPSDDNRLEAKKHFEMIGLSGYGHRMRGSGSNSRNAFPFVLDKMAENIESRD